MERGEGLCYETFLKHAMGIFRKKPLREKQFLSWVAKDIRRQ
jgi:hypothetical protein